ncbi:MAG: GYF domain-containing protein [Verrucomicrobiota bacterium]
MSEWYYARGGQQSGPVTIEQLGELARSGGLDASKDLVWTSTMKDWVPAGQVAELFKAPAYPAMPAPDPANPYAAPQSAWTEAEPAAHAALEEIVPGSEPIDVGACVKRGFNLTTRHFGIILLVGLTYFGVTLGAGVILGVLDAVLNLGQLSHSQWQTAGGGSSVHFQQNGSPLNMLVSQVLSSFLSLGATRIGLNLVSGKQVAVSQLFGEGRKLLRALGATILFGLVMFVGCLLLIAPGIYVALRYGQFIIAIVDRDLGIMEAFAYSSSLTTHNRGNLFLLALLVIAIIFAGLLACGIGLIFAAPVVWLSSMVAYRWMQYGHRAALDHPGTITPMLASA